MTATSPVRVSCCWPFRRHRVSSQSSVSKVTMYAGECGGRLCPVRTTGASSPERGDADSRESGFLGSGSNSAPIALDLCWASCFLGHPFRSKYIVETIQNGILMHSMHVRGCTSDAPGCRAGTRHAFVFPFLSFNIHVTLGA